MARSRPRLYSTAEHSQAAKYTCRSEPQDSSKQPFESVKDVETGVGTRQSDFYQIASCDERGREGNSMPQGWGRTAELQNWSRGTSEGFASS